MILEEQFYNNNRMEADKCTALCLDLSLITIIVTWICNKLGCFSASIPQNTMNIVLSITIILLGGPIILTEVLKIHKIWVAYLNMTGLVIVVSVLYCVFNVEALFALLLPLFVVELYFDKKVTIYTIILSYLSIIASHYIGIYTNCIPEKIAGTINTPYEVTIYALIPRLVVFSSFVVVTIVLSKRASNMLQKLFVTNKKMQTTQEELVRNFAEISESKSRHTGSHIKRVAKYMKCIAKATNWDDETCENLSIASMMHDIGKLMIPSEIIEKRGPLTDEEFNIIKEHVIYGYELLKDSPGEIMEMASIIALEHHERWDGTGYLGKKGEEIHIYSRAMALVDVFDAMVSKRPYKEKWPIEIVYDEIVSQRGKQFDPKMVDIFIEHFDEFKEILIQFPD